MPGNDTSNSSLPMVERLYKRLYRDQSLNGTTAFYNWIRAELNPNFKALNIGAGPSTRDPRRVLRGEVKEIVGVDIDPAVLLNEELDRAGTIVNGQIPEEDGYFDLVFADFVLEHVENPARFLKEVHRVLKPGSSFFFRTPNLFHYVTLISAMTPHWVHLRVANAARGMNMDAHEPWPTFYRMNRRKSLEKATLAAGFSGIELRMIEPEPSYMRRSLPLFLLGSAYERIVNSTTALESLRVNILGKVKK
ncbi:class I SAM-dependent methyltransferase [Mesorhizobium sp. M0213]|uniref:class I SAM-dependent methyltransferase n=1 Tax=Mesorhizobium sp. M0213 TaxID=2956917 RepID=UPI003337605B